MVRIANISQKWKKKSPITSRDGHGAGLGADPNPFIFYRSRLKSALKGSKIFGPRPYGSRYLDGSLMDRIQSLFRTVCSPTGYCQLCQCQINHFPLLILYEKSIWMSVS